MDFHVAVRLVGGAWVRPCHLQRARELLDGVLVEAGLQAAEGGQAVRQLDLRRAARRQRARILEAWTSNTTRSPRHVTQSNTLNARPGWDEWHNGDE